MLMWMLKLRCDCGGLIDVAQRRFTGGPLYSGVKSPVSITGTKCFE